MLLQQCAIYTVLTHPFVGACMLTNDNGAGGCWLQSCCLLWPWQCLHGPGARLQHPEYGCLQCSPAYQDIKLSCACDLQGLIPFRCR